MNDTKLSQGIGAREKNRLLRLFLAAVLSVSLLGGGLLVGCSEQESGASTSPSSRAVENSSTSSTESIAPDDTTGLSEETFSFEQIPEYSGKATIEINEGMPFFTAEELALEEGTEIYAPLDERGRAGVALAMLCTNTRPAEGKKRNTNMPDPSGWKQAYYPEISLDHLYERSHLIAYSLSDEAVNPHDLITGTHFLNQSTMSQFEEQIRDYLDVDDDASTHERHVLMRVTPDFRGNELVARGVLIEALSIDDDGRAICINTYCYNVQPGVAIDYATGASALLTANEAQEIASESASKEKADYVVNTNTNKFHTQKCSSVADMKAKNRKDVNATREELLQQGYEPCKRCKP